VTTMPALEQGGAVGSAGRARDQVELDRQRRQRMVWIAAGIAEYRRRQDRVSPGADSRRRQDRGRTRIRRCAECQSRPAETGYAGAGLLAEDAAR
jgi:hypothetical protein